MRPNGTAIRDIRKGQNIGLRLLAERTGLDRSHLSRIERGKVRNPASATLQRIADGLKVPVDAITHRGEDVTTEPSPTPAQLDPLKRYTPEQVADKGWLPWTAGNIRKKAYAREIFFHKDGGKITFTAEDIRRTNELSAVEPFAKAPAA